MILKTIRKETEMKSAQTCHSEYGPIHTLFLNRVEDAFQDAAKIESEWQVLNYLGRPDLSLAQSEYQQFVALLSQQDIDIHYLGASADLSMDALYCRDASIATDAGMILCQMGKAQRQGEPSYTEQAFLAAGIPILGRIEGTGKVEGGDVAWLDEQTLAVGHGYRSNHAGFKQLKALLEPIGVQLIQVHLPHYKGPSDVFHLMSILSPVDHNLAVVYSPLMPVSFRNDLLDRGYELVEVPEAEFESMGCNVLAIAPRLCLMVAGNPHTKAALEAAGCTVLEYSGNEISVKGGGGPTCLTRPIWRSKEGV